jgi:hypothetical protein
MTSDLTLMSCRKCNSFSQLFLDGTPNAFGVGVESEFAAEVNGAGWGPYAAGWFECYGEDGGMARGFGDFVFHHRSAADIGRESFAGQGVVTDDEPELVLLAFGCAREALCD